MKIIYIVFFVSLISHSLSPNITFHTRFTRINDNLIDNIFCKLSQSTLESTAGILIKQLSEDQLYFIFINTSFKKKLHFFNEYI